MSDFELFIGIDYSGAQTPTSRLKGLRVYNAKAGEEPQQVKTPAIAKFLASGNTNPNSVPRYWTRSEIAHWLVGLAKDGVQYLAGIDHGFSFPESYLVRYGLTAWPQFLEDFCHHWPTDEDHVYVDFVRDGVLERSRGWPPPDARVGNAREYRLCDRRSRTAKSVFHFDVQGSVAKSTHAGIPWLRRVRETAGDRVHFWPFDGWQPSPGRAKPPYKREPIVPPKLGWPSLLAKDGDELEVHYRHVLEELGKKTGMLGEIFKKARQEIQNPATLKRLIVDLIEPEQWIVAGSRREGRHLRRAARQERGGVAEREPGQYFTPRELIRAIVDVMQPKPDDTVCDPACGTGGFLLAAHDYVSRHYGAEARSRTRRSTCGRSSCSGWELVPATARLCIMNLYLHGINARSMPGAVRAWTASPPIPAIASAWCSPIRRSARRAASPSSTRKATWRRKTPPTSGRTSGRRPRTSS